MNIQQSIISLKNIKMPNYTSIQEANPIDHIFITLLNILILCPGDVSRQLFFKEWS